MRAAAGIAGADVKAIKADVAAAHPTRAQKKALSVLETAEASAVKKYKAKIDTILAVGKADAVHLASLVVSFEAHPTRSSLAAKVSKGLTALENVFSSTVVTTVETDAGLAVDAVDADLNALASAVPTAGADVATAETHFASDLVTLSSDATAIQGDIAVIAADIG